MLQLPAEINAELSPGYSKAEIQSIKDEIDEEKRVTDIERMLEGESDKPLIAQVIMAIGKDHPQLYLKISRKILNEGYAGDDVAELMAPQGEITYSARVQGKGRVMLMISEESLKLVNTRTGEKEDTDWHEIGYWWSEIVGTKVAWERLYGEPFPEKAEAAPVQQKAKKPTKVVKAKPEVREEPKEEPLEQRTLHELAPDIPLPKPIEPETEEAVPEGTPEKMQEENLPGQQDIETDYPETVPYSVNAECEGILEADEQEAEMTPVQEILLKRAGSMIGHIRESEWEEALADLRQLKECMESIRGGNE